MVIIRSKAPVRISFAGGGTDVSPYCEEYGGCVVNAAIDQYAWATFESIKRNSVLLESDDYKKRLEFGSLEDIGYDGDLDLIKSVLKNFSEIKKGFKVFLRSQVPPKSGLGSSASAFVAVIGLFNHLRKHKHITDSEVAELAYKLEREELGNPGGRQDQYTAVFGGLNYIEFKGEDFVKVNPLKLKRDYLLELEKNLILVYVGERKKSGDIIADQIKRSQKKSGTLDALHQTKSLAEEIRSALIKGDLDMFGELLHKCWMAKKRFSPMVSNSYIDQLYKLAKDNGAMGGKITGAGGGGHMIFYCEPNKEQVVARKLIHAGAKVVNFSFDCNGLQTWEV